MNGHGKLILIQVQDRATWIKFSDIRGYQYKSAMEVLLFQSVNLLAKWR